LDASEAFDTEGVIAIPGAAELVRSLPPNAWAIATSGTRAVALTRLRHTGLPLPAVLITADDVKRGKPNPEGYMLAARRLSMAPDRCVVLEDAPAGVDAARAAGMRVVGLTTTHSRAELKGADVTAAQLADIQVSASDTRPAGGLTVCITKASRMVGKKVGACAVILDGQGRVRLVKHDAHRGRHRCEVAAPSLIVRQQASKGEG
jgi:HAD superfamily hydrolase (TIGR01509 family)